MTLQTISTNTSSEPERQLRPHGTSILPVVNDQLEKLITQNFKLSQALQESQRKTIDYETKARDQGRQVKDLSDSNLLAAEKIESLRGDLNKFMREREEIFGSHEDVEIMGMEEITSPVDKNGNTRMHLLENHVEKTLHLIERVRALSGNRAVKTLVNTENSKGEPPLQYATHQKVAELLISSGAKVNAHDTGREKATALHRVHNKSVAKLLIDEGADIEAKDALERTPLHTAQTVDVMELLIETKKKQLIAIGANPNKIKKYVNARDHLGRTALHYAFLPEVIQLLSRNGADIHAKDLNKLPPLHTVVHCQSELLTPQEASYLGREFCSIRPPKKEKLLRILQPKEYRKNAPALIHALCDLGAQVDSKDKEGNTLLHKARDIEIVKQILSEGADINILNRWGASPLHYACESSPEIIKLLAARPNVKLNQKDQFSFTPLGLCIALYGHCNLFLTGNKKENEALLKHAKNSMNTMQRPRGCSKESSSSRPPRLSWMHWYYGMKPRGKAKRSKGWYN